MAALLTFLTSFMRYSISLANSSGTAYPTVSGMLTTVAPASITASTTSRRNSGSVLVPSVDFGGGKKYVYHGLLCALNGLGGTVYIFLQCAGERLNADAFYLVRDCLDGIEVTRRGDGKTCLYDVYSKARKLVSYLEFLVEVEAHTRGLLAVSQGGIEYGDSTHYLTALRDK